METKQAERGVCAAIARSCGEAPRGTAAVVRSWLLVEQPGAWGPDGLCDSGLDTAVARELELRTEPRGIRVQLIRRSGQRISTGSRAAYLVSSRRPTPWMERREFDDPRELLDSDLGLVEEATSPGWGEPVRDPIYLVCTHGRKDPCCADFGRPVARALRHRGERVWESTHVGGDRFAANMVCLPHGVYYGHVAPEAADALIDSFDRGHLSLRHLRGRACDEQVLQAAEQLVRERLGETRTDAVIPVAAFGSDDDLRVHLWHDRDLLDARIGVHPAAERMTTCFGREYGRPSDYTLTDLHRRPRTPLHQELE